LISLIQKKVILNTEIEFILEKNNQSCPKVVATSQKSYYDKGKE
jgi:hypothetical protein